MVNLEARASVSRALAKAGFFFFFWLVRVLSNVSLMMVFGFGDAVSNRNRALQLV